MSPYKIDGPTSISFSGGRTSAYMLHKVLEANGGLPDSAVVCFANTGKEREETLEFVRDCGENWGVKIIWLEFDVDSENKSTFKVVDFDTASRDGEPFEYLIKKRGYVPNPVARFCTVELKIRTIHRYLKSKGWAEWDSMIGIRADEPSRMARIAKNDYGKFEDKCAPLGHDNVTKETVSKFWESQSFDLNLPNNNGVTMHGNCDLCFLKGASQILSLISEKPQSAIWWAKIEATTLAIKPSGSRFRTDRPSYQQMMTFSKNQSDMFADDNETISCFCGD